MTFTDGDRTVTIDSRTSDAIAIAMRTNTPIFTTREILNETGFEMEVQENADHDDDATDLPDGTDEEEIHTNTTPKLENYAVEELEKTLDRLIEREEYEEAARVAEILRRKRNSQ